MASVTFDTLKFANRLIAAGVSEAQARAEAEALRDVFSEAIDTKVATHTDMLGLENKIETLTVKSEGRFNLLQWMIGFNLAFTMAIMWKIFS